MNRGHTVGQPRTLAAEIDLYIPAGQSAYYVLFTQFERGEAVIDHSAWTFRGSVGDMELTEENGSLVKADPPRALSLRLTQEEVDALRQKSHRHQLSVEADTDYSPNAEHFVNENTSHVFIERRK